MQNKQLLMTIQPKYLGRCALLLMLLLLSISLGIGNTSTSQAAPLSQFNGSISSISPLGSSFTYPGAVHLVRVVDSDENKVPGPGNDSFTVTARNMTQGTSEDFTIIETTPAVFETTFNIGSGAINAQLNDQILFEYVDNPDALGGATVRRTFPFTVIGTNANLIVAPLQAPPGTNIIITVLDSDRNLNLGGGNDSITLEVRNATQGGGWIPITVNEEDFRAGIFTANFSNISTTVFGQGGNPVPYIGDTIEIRYNDQFRLLGAPEFLIQTHVITGTEASLRTTPSDFVSPAGTLTIDVIDYDQNVTQGPGNDIVTVRVINTDGSFIDFTLNETNGGEFRGVFNLSSFPVRPTVGQQVRVQYVDQRGGGLTETLEVSITVRGVDAILLAPDALALDGTLTITVRDPDMNANAGPQNDTVSVLIEKILGAGEPSVNKVLNETTNPGEFFISITPITTDFPLAAVGDEFRITYIDVETASGAANVPRTRIFRIVAGDDAVLSVTPRTVEPNGEITIRVTDMDLNLNPGGENDTATVEVRNTTLPSNWTPVTLGETTIEGSFSAVINVGDYNLNAREGDRLEVRYIDAAPLGGGGPKTYVVEVFVRRLGTDATITVTDTIPGRPIDVEVFDPDLGADVTEVEVIAFNVTLNDVREPYKLQSTGERGRFRGQVITGYDNVADRTQDGVVTVRGGDIVSVRYTDFIAATGFDREIFAEARVLSRRQSSVFCSDRVNTSTPVWRAEYFPNRDFSGGPAVVADETRMNINWEETAPYRWLPADNWSARWSTSLQVFERAKFRITVAADDGARLFVNNQLVIDNFTTGPFRESTVDLDLDPGTVTFRLEYFEAEGTAALRINCNFFETQVAALNPRGERVDVFPSDFNFEEAIAHITTGRINVRANPIVTAQRIAYVHIYQRYPILGVTEDFGWYLIQLRDGRTGWVASQFVKRYERIPVQIYPVFAGSEAALPNVEVAGYAISELSIQTAPRSNVQIGIVPQNAAFRVLARSQSGAWYRIEFEGVNGWVYAPYVGLTNGTVQDLTRE